LVISSFDKDHIDVVILKVATAKQPTGSIANKHNMNNENFEID
jgi:hypothetical protein